MNEIVQYFYNPSLSKEKRSGLLKKVNVDYCIPDTPPDKKARTRDAGFTILHFAASSNNVDFVEELLRLGADVVKQGARDRSTPLHLAPNSICVHRKSGQLKKDNVTDTLLSRQVKINNTLNPKRDDGVSHLHIACIVNHAEAVEFFAKAKEPLDQPTSKSCWLPGYTPLHYAIRYSSVEAVHILLRYGADVYAKNAKGVSCLHFLIKRIMNMTDFIKIGKRILCTPYEEEIRRLESIIDSVQKTRANDGTFLDDIGLSALHVACTLRDKTVVEDILKKGISVNLPVKSESKCWPGWTPLHFAACFDIKMMMLLMKDSADIMIKNAKGETALDLCAKRFAAADVELVLSMENGFKEIILSDNSTKLSDLLLVMDNHNMLRGFLQKLKNVNITVPENSPIWPGYNLLHVSVSLNEKTKSLNDPEESLDLTETTDVTEHYNCTAEEEALYSKRIELLLEHGCDVNMINANGQTPIHLAFSTNSKSTVNKLLSRSKEDVVDRNGLSHLHIACVLGHLDAVKQYLSRGVDVNSRVMSGFERREIRRGIFDLNVEICKSVRANSTPLHLAALFGHKNVVESLLVNNADVYAQDSLGFTPIHLTMLAQLPTWNAVADTLFKATPNLRDCVSSVGLSHLHVAARANNQKPVEDLLRNGADIERVIDPNVEQSLPCLRYWAGETPLLVAENDVAAVESLLNAGANVHARSSGGDSALQLAMREIDLDSAVPFIRKVKAGECDVESCGMTRLHVACADCDLEWARRLLMENGADVNARIDHKRNTLHGSTPLHVLVYYGIVLDFNDRQLVDLVEMLVDSGADLMSVDGSGSTPLHLIYEHTYDDAFALNDDMLIETEFFLNAADLLLSSLKSYDVNPVNYQGLSHFHLACVRNDVETATKFLDHGANVNETMDPFDPRSHGFAPLHLVMAHRCREVAYLLLERGAVVSVEDVHGNRPLHVAMKTKFVDLPLIEAMITRGADYQAKNFADETLLYCLLKFSKLTLDEYLQFFELLMGYGCDIDQEDKDGAPLIEAASYYNLEAVNALLQLGADMNAVDIENKFPLDEMIAAAHDFNQRQIEVVITLTGHVWKMRLIGLNVRESNLRCLERVEESFSLISLLEQVCQDELKKARETEICQGMTVKDFLSELGAVAEYPRMSSIRQSIVDKFFKHTVHLRREFPEFCGFLIMQYKKILPRMELWQPAKETISLISKIELPDLCSEAILRFFSNIEMELLIESVKELI